MNTKTEESETARIANAPSHPTTKDDFDEAAIAMLTETLESLKAGRATVNEVGTGSASFVDFGKMRAVTLVVHSHDVKPYQDEVKSLQRRLKRAWDLLNQAEAVLYEKE